MIVRESWIELLHSLLEDVGSKQKEEFNSVIDRNMIRKARKTVCFEYQRYDKITLLLHGIYFDGREDKTMAQEETDNVKHKRTVIDRKTCSSDSRTRIS